MLRHSQSSRDGLEHYCNNQSSRDGLEHYCNSQSSRDGFEHYCNSQSSRDGFKTLFLGGRKLLVKRHLYVIFILSIITIFINGNISSMDTQHISSINTIVK